MIPTRCHAHRRARDGDGKRVHGSDVRLIPRYGNARGGIDSSEELYET